MDTQTGISLFNTAAALAKTIFDVAQKMKADDKKQLMDIYDQLGDLKRKAGDLEDENRDLKERLRFKSDEYEFRSPFFYDKRFPERPLCPKCLKEFQRDSPMSDEQGTNDRYRRCLVCRNPVEVKAGQPIHRRVTPGSPWG